MSFTAQIVISGITGRNLTSDEQRAVRATQALVLGIAIERVIFIRTLIFGPRIGNRQRNFASELETQAQFSLQADPVTAVTTTVLPMVDFPEYEGDSQALYEDMSTVLQESIVGTGETVFTEVLVVQASALNATELANSTAAGVAVLNATVAFPPSHRPTFSPRYDDGLSDGEVAAVVVVTIVCVGTLIYLFYLVLQAYRAIKPPSQDQDDKLLADGTFERLDLPDSDDCIIINLGIPEGNDYFENTVPIYQHEAAAESRI